MPVSTTDGILSTTDGILSSNHGQEGAANMILARMWQYLFQSGHDHASGSKLAAIMTLNLAGAA